MNFLFTLSSVCNIVLLNLASVCLPSGIKKSHLKGWLEYFTLQEDSLIFSEFWLVGQHFSFLNHSGHVNSLLVVEAS